jgi:dolichol-phosphate mannosyltransferase
MIYVLFPTYNEELGIGRTLKVVKELEGSLPAALRVVVVDDGSHDKTSEVASEYLDELNLKIKKFPENKGVTEVLKAGFHYIVNDSKSPETDVCVVLDADNTQDPVVMLEMLSKINAGEDIVIASRFKGNGGMIGCPLFRVTLSFGVSWIMRCLARVPNVKDYSIFYRAYRVSLMKEAFERFDEADLFYGRGFAVMPNYLIKLGMLSKKIAEVPCILRYDLKEGASGIKIFKTIYGYFQIMCKLFVNNPKPRPVR